jgi:neutral amino acid transport system permease protein
VLAAATAGLAVLSVPGSAVAQEPPAGGSTTTQPGQAGQPPAAEEELSPIRGTLFYEEDEERIAAEGVELTLESADGSLSEAATTDENGSFEFEVPVGEYTVSIDPDSLPEGVSLADEDRTSQDVTIRRAGRGAPAFFDLTTGDERTGRSLQYRVLRLSVQGIRFGLILAMCSIGLSLIFGTTGLVNFAHGEMVSFGALMAYLFNVTWGIPMLLAAPMAIAAGAVLGSGFNRGVWRPLRNRGTGLVAMLVVSIGIGLMMRYVFLYQFGGSNRGYADFQTQRVVEFGPISLVPRDLWIIGLSVLLLVLVALFLTFTVAGKAMRAVADNRDLAEASGINVERVISWVWITGGALAATGGVFNALDEAAGWQVGFQLLLLMFAAVTLGGLGTAFGALVGGLAIGMFIQLSTLFIDSVFKTSAALLVLILVLLVRPQGILGQAERVG